MAKARIIIADTDEQYAISLQHKFVEEYFEKVDLEVITDPTYFDTLFDTPQKADILIVNEDMYSMSIQKHNIKNVFLMSEQMESDQTFDLKVNRIYKYTSIKEIFNEILGISAMDIEVEGRVKKECQVVLVTSAAGGVGKTTVAIGLSAALAKKYKRVLYVNTNSLQHFQYLLSNIQPIFGNDVYANMLQNKPSLYSEIKHVIRNENFWYLPPSKTSLMSLGISSDMYETFIEGAKKSQDYDYIVVDSNNAFDAQKARLMDVSDQVIVVTKQNKVSVLATNRLVENINGINSDKYCFVCNDFDPNEDNALKNPGITLKFSVGEFLEHLYHYDQLNHEDFSTHNNFLKVMYLID